MNDRIEQIAQDAEELVNVLESPVFAVEARAVQAIDAMDDLKNEVLGFFKNRMASISRAERVKELVFHQLERGINDNEYNFEQLMTVLMRLDRGNNELSDSIISMFRPAGNGGGSLLTDIVRPGNDKSELAQAFEKYTPEELRKVNETMKVIRDIVESGKTVDMDGVKKEL
jgi:hypothetical protein